MKRVVVTGMGGLSPMGNDWATIEKNLRQGDNSVCHMEEWGIFEGLNTRLAAPVPAFQLPSQVLYVRSL